MKDEDKPISKRELVESERIVRGEIMQSVRVLSGKISEIEDSLLSEVEKTVAASELRIRTEIQEQTKGIIDQFNFVAEQIRADISGANKDEISSIENKVSNLEVRLQSLEKSH